MTQKSIDKLAKEISNMNHYDMCKVWRFAVAGDPRLDSTLIPTGSNKSLSKLFSDRLFKHFGGFTPEISKALGW